MNVFRTIFSAFWLSVTLPIAGFSQNVISLDGDWKFSLDQGKKNPAVLERTIHLPGTTDEAGFGNPAPVAEMDNQWTFGWRRPVVYEGWAWYEREVDIPASWASAHIELFLEQTRSETSVWVDGAQVEGVQQSLLTSHCHDLSSALTPGRHTIRLLLDNGNKHGIGGSYIRSAMGQGNWQGIVGRIELRRTAPFWIENVIFTPAEDGSARIEVCTDRCPGIKDAAIYQAEILDGSTIVSRAQSRSSSFSIDISKLALWDEFDPRCYTLRTTVLSSAGRDVREETIGVRFVTTNEKNQFCINGRPIFLRGTVSYNIFPLTGYPATDVESWTAIFSKYKEWGMNHVRFHSLTPPEAALEAADRMGIYLQCEAPKAGRTGNPEDDAFHIAEGLRVLAHYGNHPSFILMSMGNELAGSIAEVQNIYDNVTAFDHRRLYTTTTGNSKKELRDDYKIYGGIVRGFKGPFTDWDYRETAAGIGRPMFSHEVGQWNTYPDIRIIDKYTGVMKPDNLVLVRERLSSRGLLDRAAHYVDLTGRVAALLYKDELEGILRTPDYGGFQILMLNDFPAQGTATSGMLDIFNDEKGYITAPEFRQYCAPVVPLARFPKRTYARDETFRADIDLSVYTPADLESVTLEWDLRGGGVSYASGTIDCGRLATGNVHRVGSVECALDGIDSATAVQLVVSVAGTGYSNRWNLWVYPHTGDTPLPTDVHLARSWDDARAHLAAGEKVLYFPSADALSAWRPGQFKTIFWSPIWLKRGVETMSIDADIAHPALRSFPTAAHTDWQWFSVLENSMSFSIDALPQDFSPIVGLVDSYRKCQRLANIIEARVGEGRLLMTTINLVSGLDDDIARANLKKSILDYMASDEFQPACQLSTKDLDPLFEKKVTRFDGDLPAGTYLLDISADGRRSNAAKGYSASFGSKTQTSGDITAWADKRDLDISLTLPKGQSAELFLYLRNSRSSKWGMLKTPQEIAEVDWVEETFDNYGNKNPVCCIIVNDCYIETLHSFGTTGHWYSLHLSPEQTASGKVSVKLSTFNNPNILTRLALSAAQ